MRILSALFEATMIPADIVKDVCTWGGELSGEVDSYTRQRIVAIEDHLRLR